MHLSIRYPTGTALGGGVYANIPVGYRPARNTGYMPAVWAGMDYHSALVTIDTEGNLRGVCPSADGNLLVVSATWMVV